jgi:hypothetical protein
VGRERPPLEVGRQWMGGHADSNTETRAVSKQMPSAEMAVCSPQLRTIQPLNNRRYAAWSASRAGWPGAPTLDMPPGGRTPPSAPTMRGTRSVLAHRRCVVADLRSATCRSSASPKQSSYSGLVTTPYGNGLDASQLPVEQDQTRRRVLDEAAIAHFVQHHAHPPPDPTSPQGDRPPTALPG